MKPSLVCPALEMHPAQRLDARLEKNCHRWSLAISVFMLVMQPDDRTKVTLPDAEIDYRGRPGPKLLVALQ